MDNELISALKELCLTDKPAALVTILKTKGSTPRKAGAKMLVTQEGQVIGTIGGGCGEAEVKREALNALNDLKAAKYMVNMTQDLAAEEGMVCGGVMEVLIDILPPGQNKEKKLIQDYIEALENNEEPLLVTVIDNEKAPKIDFMASQVDLVGKLIITSFGREVSSIEDQKITKKLRDLVEIDKQESQTKLIEDQDLEIFLEPPPISVELVILGGGHIALPLCNLAKTLGYQVTVVDDRPSFANQVRFTRADRVICDDFVDAIERISITSKSFVVIVTRGHRHDKVCLQAVIRIPAAYIGMIGSKRRVKALMAEIIDEGFAPEDVAKIHSPIGLDIGAETPEEIAVSILAEVINVHRGGAKNNRKK